MRLVDVTDVEKFIREKVCVIGDDHLLLVAADDGKWHEALPLIKTAYDVDKVVEELEEYLKSERNFNDIIDTGSEIKNPVVTRTIGRIDAFEKAIEIVKQGGVSDDCCEWEHSPTDNNVIRPFHHKDVIGMYEDVLCKFPYCPVCGKKIKVVE